MHNLGSRVCPKCKSDMTFRHCPSVAVCNWRICDSCAKKNYVIVFNSRGTFFERARG